MSAFRTVWDGLDWSFVTQTLLSVVPALICITLHEMAHGLVALWLGDTTARDAGRLTLNPLRHIDIWGLLMMVICGFGWAKPVPVNMYNFKNPKRGMALTALAGPAANIIISCLALALYGRVYASLYDSAAGAYVLQMIELTAYLSCALAVFNILPIPPLDGSKVLFSLVGDRTYSWLMRYERYGFLILMALVFFNVISGPLSAATGWVYEKLFSIAQFTFGLVN